MPDNLLDKYKVINKLEIPWGPSNIVKVVKIEKGANLGKSIKKSINSGKDKPKGTGNKIDSDTIKKYIRDIEGRTGRELPKN